MLRTLCYRILLGTILLVSAIPALAQGIPDLIVPVSEVDAQTPVALIGEQQQRLETIRTRPYARNVRLVRFANPMQVLRAHHVRLLLDGRQSVLAHTRGVTPHENGLTWIGTIGEDPELQTLTLKGEEASGRIRIGETVYLVESIGGGLHAVFTVKPDYASPLDRVGERHEEEATKTKLIVYDAMGREAARLLDRSMEAGFHRIPFNGADLPSGAYVYRIVAGGYSASRRMVLLR